MFLFISLFIKNKEFKKDLKDIVFNKMDIKKTEFKNVPWSLEQLNTLNEYNTGADIKVLAEKINRSPNAVAQKLVRLGIITNVSEARGYEQKPHKILMKEKKEKKNKPSNEFKEAHAPGKVFISERTKKETIHTFGTKLSREIFELKTLVLKLSAEINELKNKEN